MAERYGLSSGRKAEMGSESIEGMPEAETWLHFGRHGKKAGGNDVSSGEDLVMPLTSEGWDDSFAAGRKIERLPGAQTMVAGSDRLRARQTPAAARAAGHSEITGEERSIEEIEEKLGEVGVTRVWVNRGLAMPFEKGVTPGVDRILEAYAENRYLGEVLKLHQEAIDQGEPKGSSIHAKEVYGMANIIGFYGRITPKLVENPAVNHRQERFFGTHGGVQEAFWIELIRKLKGEEDVEKFLAAAPNGVGYNEGMEVKIKASGRDGEPEVHIAFTAGKGDDRYTFDETVPTSIIKELVDEFGPERVSDEVRSTQS